MVVMTGKCKICKKTVYSGIDKLAMNLHLSCWNESHKRLKKCSKIVKIKKVNLRLEVNFHDLWFGLFWITLQEMYFGVPCLVLHVWKDVNITKNNKSKKRLKKYSKILKINKLKLRLEFNLHNLWIGNFWITRKEMYIGVPCLVLHTWNEI